jgi:hypothetical protein
MRKLTIFGRDPAVVLAATAAVVSLLGAYVLHFSTAQEGALNGTAVALVALLTAASLKDGGVAAAAVGLVKAVLYVALAWHFHVSAENQAIILAAVTPLIALFGIHPNVVSSVPPRNAVTE